MGTLIRPEKTFTLSILFKIQSASRFKLIKEKFVLLHNFALYYDALDMIVS
tara:strand:+ start:303 stop:455 length:153 start_codon:yes stop_codon:yes gene_type:complete